MRFGRFELRRDERRVLRDGQAVPLGARAFDVLVMLADHRHRIVSKAELLEHVWKDQVVEEANLNVQVSNLRKLLGREPIATVPGRGYRFVMPADAAAPPQGQQVEPQAQAHPGARLPSPPPPRGPAALPPLSTPPWGRSEELAQLQTLVRSHRLVTVLGPGGIGKTTLALALAHAGAAHHRDGILWLELAQVGSPALLAAALATALHLPPSESPDPVRSLMPALRRMQVLLVLDNAEHLVEAVAQLAQAVLAGTSGVHLLVTSQAPLRLPEEQTLRLGPLEVPEGSPSPDTALQAGAVRLFVERARRLDHSFVLTDANVAAVVDICRRLDGLALAIELATARLPLLGLAGLQRRLGERFSLLTRGTAAAPARQQTLRAALDWSYGLLAPLEQRLFRGLGVFVGGFTLELAVAMFRDPADAAGPAAEADAPADEWTVIDLLDNLVHRSLVATFDRAPADGTGLPRYRLLESARDYALLSLDAAGERQAAHRRHAQVMTALAEQAAHEQWTTPESAWLARHAPELDNLRAALDWAVAHDAALAVGLAASATPLFECLSLRHEMRRRAEPLLERLPQLTVPPRTRARFLLGASLQQRDGSTARQRELALAALEGFRAEADAVGMYEALYALASCFRSFPADAVAAAAEMARIESPDWPPGLRALRPIAESKARYAEGRMQDNRAALERALPLVVAGGADRLAVIVLSNLADHALFMGPVEEAVTRGTQLCELLRRGGRVANLAFALTNLAAAQLQQPSVEAARASLSEALELMRTLEWTWFHEFGDVYALLAAHEGRLEDAARLIGWQDRHCRERGEREPNEARCRALADAQVRQALGDERRLDLERQGAGMDEDAAFAAALAPPPRQPDVSG